jgi:hypothetical protein
MSSRFSFDSVRPLQEQLNAHPVYEKIRRLEDLRCFMVHHIYSVWDFMSLIKYLQQRIAPIQVPWGPSGSPSLRYFINQLVLEEESDAAPPAADGSPVYMSHFELYCGAMREVGADPGTALEFVNKAQMEGIHAALGSGLAPEPSSTFTATTFRFIETDQPHVVAAALALGREHIIPNMFRAFLDRMSITSADAPAFHFYLNRHIHLDEDFHAPLSIRMVEELCGDDLTRGQEAEQAAREALQARIRFWDGVAAALDA